MQGFLLRVEICEIIVHVVSNISALGDVPNQLGVAYNAHVIEAILTHVAPTLGWR